MIKCTAFDDLEINSFDGVEGGYDELTVIEEEKLDQDANYEDQDADSEDDTEELRLVGPLELPENWAEGKIEVNINRCNDCYCHF
jgi:hypothetical protein